MTTYAAPSLAQRDTLGENLGENMGEALGLFETQSRTTGNRRLLDTAVALLNQTQAELDQSKREINALKKQIARLEETSTTDILTGLKNRRGFEQAFQSEMDRLKRRKSVGGVLLIIDMDNFKTINDTHGHQAGDACLRLVGQVLGLEIRPTDTAARLGGDEFVLLMTDTTAETLLNRIQAMIWELNNLSVIWNGLEIRISASIGMKPYDNTHSAEEIFSEADKDMYANKQKSKREESVQHSLQ